MQTYPAFQSLDDIVTFEQTPLSDRGLPPTTYEALKQGAAINPQAPALSFFLDRKSMRAPYTLTHQELFARITQTANALRDLGIGRHDIVAYVLPNLPQTHFTIWGGSAAGQVLAINPLLKADQIADLLRSAGVKVLVTLERTPRTDLWEKCSKALATVPSVTTVVTCSVFDWMRGPLGKAMRLASKLRAPSKLQLGDRAVPVVRFNRLIKGAKSDALQFPAPKPDDVSTMLCTGGTTGLPKIVGRTHFAEVYNSWCPNLYVGAENVGSDSVALCGLPLFHTNAMLVTGLLPWMYGAHVVLATPQGYRGDGVISGFWEIVEHYGINSFSGVPTLYGALLDVPREGRDLSSLRFAACGAAPMPVELFNSFVVQTGIKIVEAYGMTEGVLASSMNPAQTDTPRIGSIGMRFPYQDMRIGLLNDRDEFERWADVDEAGVIFISGPNVFNGYLIESQNKGIWLDHDGKRWFNTGDLARQDADGYFWMTGRKKELIIRGGHNIDPKIVEEAMHKHPAVAMAAVVGRPDTKVGEVPVMYFQKTAGAALDLDELSHFAQTHVSERAAIPKAFVELDSLPVTAIGKIHKVTLNMMEVERTIRHEAQLHDLQISALEVVQDASRGIVAKLSLQGGHDAMAKALGQYAFQVDIQG